MPHDPRFPKVACPVCGPSRTTPLSADPPAVRCTDCGLGIELLVSKNPIGDYRPDNYDNARNQYAGSCRWSRFHHDCAVADYRMMQLAAVVDPTPAASHLWIDVGSGNGAVSVVARRRGWQAAVVEASREACADLHQLHGFPAVTYGSWLAGLSANQSMAAAVVSFFDVLEHLLDFPAAVRAAAATVVPGGVVITETPDLDAAKDFDRWKHRRVSTDFTEHQYHFSESSLTRTFDRYARELKLIHVARPVEGKIQMAWRREATQTTAKMTPAQTEAASASIAQRLMSMTAVERDGFMVQLRTTNPAVYAAVCQHMADLNAATREGT